MEIHENQRKRTKPTEVEGNQRKPKETNEE